MKPNLISANTEDVVKERMQMCEVSGSVSL